MIIIILFASIGLLCLFITIIALPLTWILIVKCSQSNNHAHVHTSTGQCAQEPCPVYEDIQPNMNNVWANADVDKNFIPIKSNDAYAVI